jgi:poly-gamma-glutamate capsule biosynthesis protein CapA/YwtB (metallophosphatase superfamily)
MKSQKIYLVLFTLAVILNILIYLNYQDLKKNLTVLVDRPQTTNQNREVLDSKDEPVKVLLAGDVMLGRTVMKKSLSLNDGSFPFRKVAEKLKNSDIVFLNLENPIISDCPFSEDGFVFCARPEMLNGLISAGVDVVSLANNHSRNYRQDGLNQTLNYLDNAGILSTGLRNLVILEIKGIKFGFLGFDFTTKDPSDDDYQLISSSKQEVDILILGVHWGVEYTQNPQKYQKEWASKMIGSGADVISGHHPHWVQEYGSIENKPVFYSLGNFIFDQMWSEETKKGIVVELEYQNAKLINQNILPTYMSSWSQPEFVD